MKFKESGLPANETIEQAFNHAYGYVMAGEADKIKEIKGRIEMMFENEMAQVEDDLAAGAMDEATFEKTKDMIEKNRNERLKMTSIFAKRELQQEFAIGVVAPVKMLATIDKTVSSDVFAMMLLVPCIKTPIDYQKICIEFGDAIGNVAAEILQLDAYPSERKANLESASSDGVKLAFFTMMIHSSEQVLTQIAQVRAVNPNQMVMIPPGLQVQMFEDAQLVWGVNKKLDDKFVTLFNALSKVVGSDYNIEINAAGKPELVRGGATPPVNKKPSGPKPPSTGGGGGFDSGVF